MGVRFCEKKHLSAQGMLEKVREVFSSLLQGSKTEKHNQTRDLISDDDCLMSALAIFKLKYSSLLQFEKHKIDIPVKQNLKNLFKIKKIPCDTYLREKLDVIDPEVIRPAFTTLFTILQRGKVLEDYVYLDNKYLLLSDGTGYFSSHEVHCKNCCEKHHRNGTTTYYHQFLGTVIVHPDHKEVFPLCPEAIKKEDGATKNDCERNATERSLRKFRKEHPHLSVILVEDALASNGPHIKLLRKLDISFITVVKPKGNKNLFDWVEAFDWEDELNMDERQGQLSFRDEQGDTHKLRYLNQAPLNDTHSKLKVNFVEYWHIGPNGKVKYHNSWGTDIHVTQENVYKIARGGRARWSVENETFNTLKNQGYHFEHNYGHGYKNLSTVFAMLMMLAFLIDQVEQRCCGLFQGAFKSMHSTKKYLWEQIRSFFFTHIIMSWKALYMAIIEINTRETPVLDTS
jgi:hypothetical protein